MHLLHVTTKQLKEFHYFPPPYAILSHTWGQDEMTMRGLRQMLKRSGPGANHAGKAGTPTHSGYTKIDHCCRQAQQDGYDWVWIDTCCIDKSSSAELSEAINSMYKWYRGASVCYAYLADVPPLSPGFASGSDLHLTTGDAESRQMAEAERMWFVRSRWFTRGWTLQELIAPKALEFYASDWSEIGTRLSLESLIHEVTRIPVEVLRGRGLSNCTIAARMSWVANRFTTREEDLAYCLLGIFEVNMPLLYGEGRRAFVRLQEEILRKQEDYSLLAWSFPPAPDESGDYNWTTGKLVSLLADHPGPFGSLRFGVANSSLTSWRVRGRREEGEQRPWSDMTHIGWESAVKTFSERSDAPFNAPTITSRGILVTLPTKALTGQTGVYLAWIFCTVTTNGGSDHALCIYIKAEEDSIDRRQPRQMWRLFSPPYLAAVSFTDISSFEPTVMYLSTSNLEPSTTCTTIRHQLEPIGPMSVQVTGAKIGNILYTIPARQARRVSNCSFDLGLPNGLPNRFFLDRDSIRIEIGVISISLQQHDAEEPNEFLILYGEDRQIGSGLRGGRLYCDINTPPPGKSSGCLDVEALREMHRALKRRSDREMRVLENGCLLHLSAKRKGVQVIISVDASRSAKDEGPQSFPVLDTKAVGVTKNEDYGSVEGKRPPSEQPEGCPRKRLRRDMSSRQQAPVSGSILSLTQLDVWSPEVPGGISVHNLMTDTFLCNSFKR